MKVESPRGDALRSLRLTDESGTSLWWRSYVCGHPAGRAHASTALLSVHEGRAPCCRAATASASPSTCTRRRGATW